MALPPLPSDSTRRLYLDYTSGPYQHTMQLRIPLTGADPATYAAAYAAIFATRMHPTNSFFGARLATVGTNVTLPVAFTEVPGTVAGDAPAWDQDPESAQLSITFRGAGTGRKGRVEFFTPIKTTTWPADNRYNPGDAAPIDTLRINFTNAAQSGGTAPLITIGGDFFYVHSYVNIRSNAHTQTMQRG